MPSCCSICLEPGADAFPPCGFASAEPLFHAHCLARAQEQCSQRCPHCNCAPPLREHVFLSVKRHALLTPKELERALAVVQAHLRCRLRASARREGHYVATDGEGSLSVRRVAYVGDKGSVIRDGFTLRLRRRLL